MPNREMVNMAFESVFVSDQNNTEIVPENWVVLLTTAVNPFGKNDTNEILYREQLYKKQIHRWLNDTDYEIFVTESTGWTIPNLLDSPRLHLINFDLIKEFGKSTSSSFYESHSFVKFVKFFQETDFYDKTTHILKVTGRYFLPDINKQISVLRNYDVYIQKHKSKNWQNTEYFGINKHLLLDLANKNLSDNTYLEHTFYNFIQDKKRMKFEPFENNISRGGDGKTLNPL